MHILTLKIPQIDSAFVLEKVIDSLWMIEDIQSIEKTSSLGEVKIKFLSLQTEEQIIKIINSYNFSVEYEPFFSIIFPVYNRQDYLQDALDSIFEQRFLDFEIIAIDDESTDNSLKILEENANRFSNFRLIKSKHCGLSGVRNKGIASARGKYLCFVDSDDLISKDYLLDFYSVVTQTNADLIKNTTMEKFFTKSPPPSFLRNKKSKIGKIREINLKPSNIKIGGNVWSYCIKKDLVTKNSVCFLLNRIMEDEAFILMLLPLCEKFIIFEGSAYYYRQHSNSIVAKSPVAFDRIENFRDIIQWYQEKKVIQNFPIPFYILYDVSIKNSSYMDYIKASQKMLRQLNLEEFLEQNKLAYKLYSLKAQDFAREHQKSRGRIKYYFKKMLGIL